jgi:viroplasmin and RNaseH domain-containing protein
MEMPTYIVYKGRGPRVYDDWKDCRRQVHRFSDNSYKGYHNRVEVKGRYARYLAEEMRRNWMKIMGFVMMFIMTMVMLYVILV